MEPALAAEPENPIKELGKAIANFYGELTKQRLTLYLACTTYYARFKRWPSNKDNLLAVKDAFTKEGEDNDALSNLLNEMDITFVPLDDASVLIKGQYDEKIERDLENSGIGKCRISMVASLEKDTIIFKPSDDVKSDKNFFNLPAKVNLNSNTVKLEPSPKKEKSEDMIINLLKNNNSKE
jgi:hypothetical protein